MWDIGQMPNLKRAHERRLGRQAVYWRDIIVCLIKEGNVILEVIFGTVSVSTKLLSKRFLEGSERLTNSKFSTTSIFIQCLVVKFHFPVPHPMKKKPQALLPLGTGRQLFASLASQPYCLSRDEVSPVWTASDNSQQIFQSGNKIEFNDVKWFFHCQIFRHRIDICKHSSKY